MLHRSPSWPQHCGRLWASCFAESLSLGFLMLHDSFQAIPFKKNFTLSNAMFSNVSYQVTQSFESSRNHGGCSVTQSCLTLCNPMGWLQRTRLPCPSLCPTFCSASWPLGLWCYLTISSSAALFSSCLPFFPASVFFSNESALRIRWLEYWSFSFSISPSNEYFGLISFRMD